MKTEVKIPTPYGEVNISGDIGAVSKLILMIEKTRVFDGTMNDIANLEESKENKSQKIYYCSGRGANASGYPVGKNFRVVKGSTFCHELTEWAKGKDLKRTRDHLIEKGFLTEIEGKWILMVDYDFSSASNAASNVLGRSANGNTEWKDETGLDFKPKR